MPGTLGPPGEAVVRTPTAAPALPAEFGAGGTGILSVAAGDEATPVFGNGAGVGSGTFSAKTPAGLKMASPPINATITIAGPSFAKPRSAINPSPAATPPVMHPRTQCSTRP